MEYELRITGRHCTACAQSIEQYLGSGSGVTDVTVSYDAGRGAIALTPDAEIEEVVAAIERMGFGATVLDAE